MESAFLTMRFALTVEPSESVANKTYLIHNVSNKLSEYFSDKNYGDDVKQILIGVICVAPEFDWFSTIRKPKYVFYRKYVRDSSEIIEDKVFTFDLKIDYENFKNQPDEQNNKMLALEIQKSLTNLNNLPKKVKDFDKERFEEDMKAQFRD